MILGYLLRPYDNDSYMLRGDMPHPACELCGYVISHDWVDPNFRLRNRKLDAGYTYDGYLVVSQRFLDLVPEAGAAILPLPSEPGYFVMSVYETVRFDALRRKTTFEGLCERCGRYEAVAGATPVFLSELGPLPNRLVRTDVEFGTGDEKHPLILMGPDLGKELSEAGLAGVDLAEVTHGAP